jgi:hypothetical protein
LSWALQVTQSFIQKISDGIVSQSSSLALNAEIATSNGKKLQLERDTNSIPLEHWEQVQDYRLFHLLGTSHVSYIRDQQQKVYVDLIETSL